MKNTEKNLKQPALQNDDLQLTIIIVSFNTRVIIADCLRSIQNCSLPLAYEILVIDNASSDGSPEMIERDFPEVKLIRNSENLMFAKANNQGMRIAKGKYLLLLNSDTLIQPGNLEKLYNFIDRHQPEVGCVGPRVVYKDGSLQSEGEMFDSLGNVLSNFFFLHKLPLPFAIKAKILPWGFPYGLKGRTRRVGWVYGCCMMFPREIVADVGGLDESFGFYNEEIEFCYRLMKHGFETWVIPDATITHFEGASVQAVQGMENYSRPKIPPRFQDFLLYQKTSGVHYKIRLDRLRIFLYSAVLPALKLLHPPMALEVREKIKHIRKTNRLFMEQLKKQLASQPQ